MWVTKQQLTMSLVAPGKTREMILRVYFFHPFLVGFSNPKIQTSEHSILKDFSLRQWAAPIACDCYLYSPVTIIGLCYHGSMINAFKTQMKI